MVGTLVLTGHQKERRESCSYVVLEGLQQRALAVFWEKRTVSCLLGWDNGMRVGGMGQGWRGGWGEAKVLFGRWREQSISFGEAEEKTCVTER